MISRGTGDGAARFSRFAAIDWSGAKGTRHPGIALAVCENGTAAPKLVSPPHKHWSRGAILAWILDQQDDVLIGFDFSFAPPFVERGAYFPADPTATNAKALWAHVEARCDDEDFGAASLIDKHYRRHFYCGAADGQKADYMHLRRCEALYNAQGGGKPSSIYDVVGAAQVAKASFAGMRILHHLSKKKMIWPFDVIPEHGPLVLEIYTQIAARASGLRKGLSKIRTAIDLDRALNAIGSAPHTMLERYTDHATDAILTAAWLRANAGTESLWIPQAMSHKIAQTEGWTFGVV
jgi:hypothetical protein